MTIPRMVGVLVGLTVIGIAVVAIRVDEARHARRIQELQIEQTELRQQIWSQDMELARLRSPHVIRQRAAQFGLEAGRAETPPPKPVPARR